MKRPNQHRGIPHHSSPVAVAATFDDPVFMKYMAEKLSARRCHYGLSSETVPDGWTALDTSSVEAFVNGTMHITCGSETFQVPFVKCFLFTCCREIEGEYKLSFLNCLS